MITTFDGQDEVMWIWIIIFVALLLAWCVIVMAPAAKLAYEDRGLSEERQRGVSVFPVLPFVPLLAGAVAVLADKYIGWWLAVTVLSANGLLFIFALLYIVYWLRRLVKSNMLMERD